VRAKPAPEVVDEMEPQGIAMTREESVELMKYVQAQIGLGTIPLRRLTVTFDVYAPISFSADAVVGPRGPLVVDTDTTPAES
jgi:hypothetical protein